MKKILLLVLCVVLVSGCDVSNNEEQEKLEDLQENEIMNDSNEEIEEVLIDEEFKCIVNEYDYEVCSRKALRGSKIIDEIIIDEEFTVHYDETCPECGFVSEYDRSPTDFGKFWVDEIDYTKSIIFNKENGQIITVLDGVAIILEEKNLANEYIASERWFTLFDDVFKLYDMNTLQWYGNYCLDYSEAPQLMMAYDLGNGVYFDAYIKEEDVIKTFILDYDGNVVLENDTASLSVTSNNKYFVKVKDFKYGLVTVDGVEVLPMEYQAIRAYENGIVAIKENRLYVYSSSMNLLVNGEYELTSRPYWEQLCCDNVNNFESYERDGSLYVTTIDTDYYYNRKDNKPNPKYMHKLKITGEEVVEVEYDFKY